jgi:hypothetical protein
MTAVDEQSRLLLKHLTTAMFRRSTQIHADDSHSDALLLDPAHFQEQRGLLVAVYTSSSGGGGCSGAHTRGGGGVHALALPSCQAAVQPGGDGCKHRHHPL